MALPAIRLSVVENPPALLVEALGQKREFVLPALRNLGRIKADLPEMLRSSRQSIGVPGVTLTDAEADHAVDDLDICAAAIADRLIEGAPEFADIETFESAVAAMISPALRLSEGGQPPAVEIVGSFGEAPLTDQEITGLLPAELLRVAEPGAGHTPATPRDLRLRRYLGLRAVTVRRYREALAGDVIGAGQVPVAVLAYDGQVLRGPAAQAAFFRRQTRVFAGRYWPEGRSFPFNDLALAQVMPYQESALATSMVNEILEVTGLAGLEATPYSGAILHLCCHYFTEKVAGTDQAAPFLSFDDLRKNVSVHALRGALASAPKRSLSGLAPGLHFAKALVMLNACMTAASAPFGDGMPRLLFSRGFRHVIASETLVPDGISSAFAEQFYLALMRGATIGQGVLAARQAMINVYENSGGLLYTLYGDPELALALGATASGDAAGAMT